MGPYLQIKKENDKLDSNFVFGDPSGNIWLFETESRYCRSTDNLRSPEKWCDFPAN